MAGLDIVDEFLKFRERVRAKAESSKLLKFGKEEEQKYFAELGKLIAEFVNREITKKVFLSKTTELANRYRVGERFFYLENVRDLELIWASIFDEVSTQECISHEENHQKQVARFRPVNGETDLETCFAIFVLDKNLRPYTQIFYRRSGSWKKRYEQAGSLGEFLRRWDSFTGYLSEESLRQFYIYIQKTTQDPSDGDKLLFGC